MATWSRDAGRQRGLTRRLSAGGGALRRAPCLASGWPHPGCGSRFPALESGAQGRGRARFVLTILAALSLGAGARAAAASPDLAVANEQRLLAVSWQVHTLLGQRLQLPQPLVLHFVPQGLLEGNTGCNRLAAEYRLEGDSLRTVGLRRTQQVCSPEAAQRQESLMQLLSGLQSYAFDADGRLILYSTEGTLAALARRP